MTAKEYLNRLRLLDIKINQKLEEISALRASLKSISAVNNTDERVLSSCGSSDASFVRTLVKIDEIEHKVNDEIDNFVNEKHKIINEIHKLTNPLHIEILHKKYVEFKSLVEVAEEMHYTYQYIVLLHGYALQEFKKNFLYIFND